ncbi:unnamed protein product, partial [Ectocarpus sp. 4 AP-2014]
VLCYSPVRVPSAAGGTTGTANRRVGKGCNCVERFGVYRGALMHSCKQLYTTVYVYFLLFTQREQHDQEPSVTMIQPPSEKATKTTTPGAPLFIFFVIHPRSLYKSLAPVALLCTPE